MTTISLPLAADRDARRRSVVLGTCCLSVFIAGLDVTIVNVALPSIQGALHGSVSGLQWTIDAYTLVIASLLMLSGSLADRFGRRRIFQIGLGVFTVGSLLCSLAPSLGWLIAFRGLQAVGGSMLNPVAMAIIANTFTDRAARAKAIGIWGSVAGLSLASGPVLGGLLVNGLGWRSIFWVNVPVALIAIVLTQRFVPESRAERPRRLDPAGQVAVIAMLGCLTAGIIEGPRNGWGSAPIVALFVGAVVAAVALVLIESRRRDPLIDVRYFRSAPFSGAALIGVVALATLGGFLFLNTLYLQDVRGYSALQAGLLTIPMAAMLGVFSLISGRLVASRGPRLALIASGALIALGAIMLTGLTADTAVVPDRRLPRVWHRSGAGQRTDHEHRAVGDASRSGRSGRVDRLGLSPNRRGRGRRGDGRDHRQQFGRVRARQPRSLGGARRLRTRGDPARPRFNRTLGTRNRRTQREALGHRHQPPLGRNPMSTRSTMPTDTASRVWIALHGYVVEHDRRRELRAALDLGPGKVEALITLLDGPMNLREIARALEIDPPAATVGVDQLEARGLVERTPHPDDKRRKLVHLTDAGREAAQRGQTILNQPPRELTDMAPDDLAQLDQLLTRLFGDPDIRIHQTER